MDVLFYEIHVTNSFVLAQTCVTRILFSFLLLAIPSQSATLFDQQQNAPVFEVIPVFKLEVVVSAESETAVASGKTRSTDVVSKLAFILDSSLLYATQQ